MPRKGKKRRDAARARREATAPRTEDATTLASSSGDAPAARQPVRRARPSVTPKKRRKEFRPQAFLPVGALVLALLVAAGVGVWVAMAGGSSNNDNTQATTDPWAGKKADVVLNIEARGSESSSSYSPTTLTAKAGQEIEIVVKNVGSVSHNLHLAGPDGQYDTLDDNCLSANCAANRLTTYADGPAPQAIQAGKEGHVFLKFDKPGTYPFRCDFHPQFEKGNLILQ